MLEFNGIVRIATDLKVEPVGETKVCSFNVCTEQRRKNKATGEVTKTPHFFHATVWDTAADVLVKNVRKGNRLFIRGTILEETWVDKTTQANKSRVVLRVGDFTLIDFNEENKTEQSDK